MRGIYPYGADHTITLHTVDNKMIIVYDSGWLWSSPRVKTENLYRQRGLAPMLAVFIGMPTK